MGNGLAGFISGFSNNQVDQIQERRKLENEEKKAKMLAQLQKETAQANFLFEENYKKSNVINEAMSTEDYETGEVTLNSLDGTKLGSRKMTKAQRDKHTTDITKDNLDMDNVRTTIASRRAGDAERIRESGRQDRESAASVGASNRSNRDASSTTPDKYDLANELVDKFKSYVKAAKDDADNPLTDVEISNIAAASVEAALRNGSKQAGAQNLFLSELRRLQSDKANKSKDKVNFR